MGPCLLAYLPILPSFRDHPIPSMPWGVLPQIHRCRVIRGTGASHQHGDLVEHGTYKVAATTETYQGLFWILKPIRLCLDHWKWLRATVTDEPWMSDDVRCQMSEECKKMSEISKLFSSVSCIQILNWARGGRLNGSTWHGNAEKTKSLVGRCPAISFKVKANHHGKWLKYIKMICDCGPLFFLLISSINYCFTGSSF